MIIALASILILLVALFGILPLLAAWLATVITRYLTGRR